MKIRTLGKIAAAACLLAGSAAFAQGKEIKLNSWLGPNHPINTGGYNPFIKAVEADTKGALKFRLFLSGSLLDSRGTLPGVRDGVVDGGFIVLSFHPAEFPHATTFTDLAMVGTDSLSAAAAVTETVLLHCAPCAADSKKQNMVFFGAYATTGYNIMSRTPVKSLDDLKGKKVRSFGGAIDRWLRELGAVAVNVDATAAYEGLSKNTLDAVMLPVADLGAYNLWDVAPNVTLLDVGSFKSNTTVGFNRDFWRDLTLEQRKIFMKNAPLMVLGPGLDYIKNDAKVIPEAKAKKVNLIPPTDAMKKQLAAFFEKDKQAINDAAVKRGVKDPNAIVSKYVELVAKYDKLFAGKQGDPEALYEIMRREVYSKLDPAKFGMD